MLRYDRFGGVYVVHPGMGQAARLAFNVQPRPTCFRKGWTAETRMNPRSAQPPNLFLIFLITHVRVYARTRTRAHARNVVIMLGRLGCWTEQATARVSAVQPVGRHRPGWEKTKRLQ